MDAAKKSISLDSNNIEGINWLSNWQWHNRQGSDSFETLENLLAINPNHEKAVAYARHAYTRLGMPEKALAYAYKSIELSPKDRFAYKYVWYLERYRENYDVASSMYRKYTSLLKEQTGADPFLDELALFYYYDAGELEKAMETLSELTDDYWRLWTETLINYREGNKIRADNMLAEFIELPKEDILESVGGEDGLPYHHFYLAILYSIKGDIDTSFENLANGYDHIKVYTEELWYHPEFKILKEDQRWQQLLDRLGEEFNFDYNTEG